MNSKTIIKVFFVNLCLIAIQVTAFAQYADTNKGNVTAENRKSEYSFEQIDRTTNKLPANYKGNPLQEILSKLIPLYVDARKGEFETTAEFNARLAKERQQPITLAGSLNSNSDFAFNLPKVYPTYNADRESFREEVKLDTIMYTDGQKHGVPLIKIEPIKVDDRYAFLQMATSYALALPSAEKGYGGGKFKLEFPMNRDLAKNVKSNLAILVVGKIDFSSDKPIYHDDAGIVNYYLNLIVQEAWLYDIATGEVYVKQKIQQ